MQVTDEMLKAAANVFCENGLHVSLPQDGDLDDVERERYETLEAALTAALAAMWRPVETELPKMDEVVLISYNSGFNGRPVITFGARIDPGEGWLWGVKRGCGADVHLDKDAGWNEIDADDDYEVTHWQPLTAPLPSPPKAEG